MSARQPFGLDTGATPDFVARATHSPFRMPATITIVVPPEVQEFIEAIFVELYNQRRYDGRIRLGLSHPMARGIDEARSWFLGAALLAGAKAVAKDALG